MTVGEGSAKWSNVHTVLAHRTMRSAHLVRPLALPMQFTPVVPARVLRPWDFEVVHPKDLAPLTGVKGRDLIFRARVLRAVLALRTMPSAQLVRPKDLLMEQGPIMAKDLVAQALTTRGIRSKVSAEDRSSDEVYREGPFEKPYPLIP